jgi:hypothetical protein
MRGTTLLLAGALAVLAGCGGGERQDADEPRGTWRVAVVEARFPERQRLAQTERMTIRVRNEDDRTIPNLAVTVDGLTARATQAGLSDPNRPVWIVDRPPTGGTTAYRETWALGPVPPGGEREFSWQVTPVQAGDREVSFRVAAGLDGRAVARTEGGDVPGGRFDVRIDGEPADSRVDPRTGEVVRG